jgi:hypothetical protein
MTNIIKITSITKIKVPTVFRQGMPQKLLFPTEIPVILAEVHLF